MGNLIHRDAARLASPEKHRLLSNCLWTKENQFIVIPVKQKSTAVSECMDEIREPSWEGSPKLESVVAKMKP